MALTSMALKTIFNSMPATSKAYAGADEKACLFPKLGHSLADASHGARADVHLVPTPACMSIAAEKHGRNQVDMPDL